MAKKQAPLSEESVKAIADYINSPERKLTETKQYFDSLERLRMDSKIPTALVSFEVLRTLHNGIENGFTNKAVLGALPKSMGNETIEVPVAVIRSLISAWERYKYSEEQNLEKSFGLSGNNNSRRPLTRLEIQETEKYYTRRVFELRMEGMLDGQKVTVDKAVEQVAEENKVSEQTVKNAYKKHRRTFASLFKAHNLPIK